MGTPLIILCLLSFPLLIALLYARARKIELNINRYACWGLGLAFIYFFIGNMAKTEEMVELLPPWIPLRSKIVCATGALELLVGIALFVPRFQIGAAKVAIAVS